MKSNKNIITIIFSILIINVFSKNFRSSYNTIQNEDKLLFKGPKALEMAEKYFGCNDKTRLKGIELDDFNSKETQDGNSIHWSARILLGDYMISELYYTEQAISELTLSSNLIPRGATLLIISALASLPFSPTPAVKTIASTLPSTSI